ncbi:cell cycle checkpoint control protein RAD9A isoform X2 [Phalaenopsis equestris]|uniref:cell cycle checkpoint control protein RAD9A isoform X2 n=1 Tax=Phalaenopsis equestris TaxID=78828 RepID=UPI0009E4BD84|nr:cell cycle checkpoint control protein RAD9A isoform X2 [Phalaenopsis equestris]
MLAFHTLNSSRSAYQSVTFKADFFDSYSLLSSLVPEIRCSVLLKSVCTIFRTPVHSLSHLCIRLSSPDASKLQWTLHCQNGARKTYWISCNVEPEIQQLSLDRRRLPTSFVVRPRDLTRLLSNFQSSLQEITIIATDPSTVPSDAEEEIGGKAVELRSYIDPAKDNSDATLHTQLWIDPSEEFLQYQHVGDPADVTFGLKELKAFLSFCEGCEVDIHLFFEKAGEPILMAPRFGFDDGTSSNFDATLVLASLLISQLNDTNASDYPHAGPVPQGSDVRRNSQSRHARAAGPSSTSEHPSDHTKIWSDLSGSVARSDEYGRIRQAPTEENLNMHTFDFVQRPEMMNVSRILRPRETETDIQQAEAPNSVELHGRDLNGNPTSQHHPSNWLGAGDRDDDDEEDEDEDELYVQSTPK